MACEFDEGSLGHQRAIHRINVLYTCAQPMSLIPYSDNLYLVLPSWSQEVLNQGLCHHPEGFQCVWPLQTFLAETSEQQLPIFNTCCDVIDRGRARGETLTAKFELRPLQYSATFNSAQVHLKWDLMRWHHISALQGEVRGPDSQSFCRRERRFGQKSLQCEGENSGQMWVQWDCRSGILIPSILAKISGF